MGKYDKSKFANPTIDREVLKALDAQKKEGESRSDVLRRLLGMYVVVKIPKTNILPESIDREPPPEFLQGYENWKSSGLGRRSFDRWCESQGYKPDQAKRWLEER